MDFTTEILAIREIGFNNEILKSILKKFEPRRIKMIESFNRYRTDETGVPIFRRTFRDSSKVNNKVNNDFYSEIIDIKVGYFAGSPFSYQYDKRADENIYTAATNRIQRFATLNNLADIDSESTKNAAIAGYAARLLYIGADGLERIASLPPFECIILSMESISKPEYGIRITPYIENGRNVRRRLEIYDAERMRVFYEVKKNTFEEQEEEATPHVFGICPLFGIPNNEELIGDVERVEALIDAYDRTISDVNSEIESFRLAYMLFRGGVVDDETIRQAQKTGAFSMPDDASIEFLTKQMNDTIVENHLNRLHENIYRFSKTPDLSDEAFAGNQSGVALKYKLFPLETKCKTFERKFNSATNYMFEGLCNSWRIRGENFDPLSYFVEYKRTFPLDLLHEAQVQQTLKGLVSEQTRLALASFVDDPEYEIEQIEEEALESVFPRVDFNNTDDETEGSNEAEEQTFNFVTE